jgi:hypothetical protein
MERLWHPTSADGMSHVLSLTHCEQYILNSDIIFSSISKPLVGDEDSLASNVGIDPADLKQ